MVGIRILQCMALAAVTAAFGQVNISGVVTDSSGAPVAGAALKLDRSGNTATSGADGKFTLTSGTAITPETAALPPFAEIHQGKLHLSVPSPIPLTITAFDLAGKVHATLRRDLGAGSHAIELPRSGSGIRFYRIEAGDFHSVVNGLAVDGDAPGVKVNAPAARVALSKSSAAALYDVITAEKTGFFKSYLSISNSEMTGVTIKLLKTTSPKFSFFIASMRGLQDLAKSENGFGGDLRFGETGPGAGLRGADKICATLAEKSMPASSFKGWRAFLSVSSDANAKPVNAIDRVGAGPWYDRLGRMLAPTVNDLKAVRPQNGSTAIVNNLPNEDGVLNHRPDPNLVEEDNHHMMTGSTETGTLKSASNTCKDWTTSDGAASAGNGKPTCGFAWPRSLGSGGTLPRDGSNWITSYDAPGCGAGVDVHGFGGAPAGSITVGAGGGYGGFYCFALNP